MEENKQLKKELDELKNKILIIERELKNHTHSGQDGSNSFFQNSIKLNAGSKFQTGNFSIEEYTYKNNSGTPINISALVLGSQANGSGTVTSVRDGSQLTTQHQPSTNGSTNQTFHYGYRSPVFLGDKATGSITSGGSVLNQSDFNWTINELVGAHVLVYDPSTSNSQFDVFSIASNTADTITITGSWTFTSPNSIFIIYVPVYLGSAEYPWRRVYVTDGSGGGIRFGSGDTAGGQNALLYTDGTNLKFRKKDGTVTTVTVT